MSVMPKYKDVISLIPYGLPQYLDFEASFQSIKKINMTFMEEMDDGQVVDNLILVKNVKLHKVEKNEDDEWVISSTGEPVDDSDCCSINSEKHIGPWFDKWIPIPFFRETDNCHDEMCIRDRSEADNKQGETKKSKWWLYLLILLLLLLFLLLLWWLLMREPNTEKDDFSFLKGTLRVKDVLENEKGQLVDMKLIFKDDSGIGESIIQTSSKTCRGSVHATVAGDNMVRFNLSQLACPDNDNFDSFDMLCNNERTSCLGTIGDGTSWEISPVIEK